MYSAHISQSDKTYEGLSRDLCLKPENVTEKKRRWDVREGDRWLFLPKLAREGVRGPCLTCSNGVR